MTATRSQTVTLGIDEARALCIAAAIGAGAGDETARSIALAAVAAESEGQASVGLSHYVDYLEALEAGRIDGKAEPEISRPALAIYLADAKGGAAHTAFDRCFDDIAKAARLFGVTIFSQKNAYTCGSLGYFTGRLAEAGLVALAATNGPALVAGSGSTKPVFCTNPISLAAPAADGPPLIIDQSSSATAFVNVRRAAEAGEAIPEGWALDAKGKPTTDAKKAMKGVLLAFGGSRGANVALMVEVLAAGVSGANWSVDAPSISEGHQTPGTGLFIAALDPKLFDPGFEIRMRVHLDRLATRYGVHIPGSAKAAARLRSDASGITILAALHARIAEFAARKQA
ncbi:Ldh family oxidoreductase [Aminobacter sp. HY435]|uniref:Ldh family oxidoreductase n=1 Tax=Aminobacter sp. HY435 TaxID=2970917 RepID=UPI0022B9A52E|nr:Ldh family oxidoreductase [Aminobacter sp. HY435]